MVKRRQIKKNKKVQRSCFSCVTCIEFEQVSHFVSRLLRNDASLTCQPQLSQGCHGETSRFSEDFLGRTRNRITGIKRKQVTREVYNFIHQLVVYLHEGVAFIHKWSLGDLLEGLADIRQRLGLLNQSLIVVDQCQSHTEQDFRALVEQAIPNPQNCLQGENKAKENKSIFNNHFFYIHNW